MIIFDNAFAFFTDIAMAAENTLNPISSRPLA